MENLKCILNVNVIEITCIILQRHIQEKMRKYDKFVILFFKVHNIKNNNNNDI